MPDPILDRIVYYTEISPELAQLTLAVARLGQVVWQLEQRQRRAELSPDGVEARDEAEV
jgi:hypothetical protein